MKPTQQQEELHHKKLKFSNSLSLPAGAAKHVRFALHRFESTMQSKCRELMILIILYFLEWPLKTAEYGPSG